MQVATLFRESATLLGAASMIESPSSNSSSSLLSSSSLVSSTNSILGGGGGGGGGTSIACINLGNLDNCQTDDGYFNNNTNSIVATTTASVATIKSTPIAPLQTMLSPLIPRSGLSEPPDNLLNSNFNFTCTETDTNLEPKSEPATCRIDHNHGYKLLSANGKPEVHDDDGYETSNGATPNGQHNNVMLPRLEIALPNATDNSDPYNFIDDDNFTQYHHHRHHYHHHHNQNDMMHMEQNEMAPQIQHHHHHSTHHRQIQQQIVHHHPTNIEEQPQQYISTNNTIGAANNNTNTLPTTTSTSPKKRGRKKKSGNLEPVIDGDPQTIGMVKTIVIKERKKHDRFNGMSEEEVTRRTLPDHLANNLDIIIIGINPGLFAAYKGHHYAGPGNHFWKCLYLSGLTRDQMTADDDYKLLDFGIGLTNMVSRPTKGSADLTRKEIKEGSRLLMEKLKKCRPKIAVFNGKLIYEVFSGKKDFNFGRQAGTVDGTNTYMWVMPSSSARCAQLPRAADKVPFYAALKKFRDYLNGVITELDETDIIVNEPLKYTNNDIDTNLEFNANNSDTNMVKSELIMAEKNMVCCEVMNLDNNSSNSGLTDLSGRNITNGSNNNNNLHDYSSPNQSMMTFNYGTYGMDGDPAGENNQQQRNNLLSNKKKRGRPKKDKSTLSANLVECDNTNSLLLINSINKNFDSNPFTYTHHHQHHIYNSGDIIKKKRGRPKKIKISNGNSGNNNSSSSSNHNMEYINYSNQNFCVPQSENSPTILDIGYATNSNTINSSDTNNNDNCSNSSISINSSKKCSKDSGTDVATKSLSGLESLVDQIPSISDNLRAGSTGGGGVLPNQSVQHVDTREQYNNSTSSQNCLYTQNYATSQAQPTYLLSGNLTTSSPHHHYNYIESSQVPDPVNPIYHHPHHHHHHHPSLAYGHQNYQHDHHSSYSNVPPTLHMLSPNYPPYGYTTNAPPPPPLPPPSNYSHSSPHQNPSYLYNQHSHIFGGSDRTPPTPTTPNKPQQLDGENYENF